MPTPHFRFSEVLTRRFAQVLYRCLEEVKSTKGALYLVVEGVPGLHLVGHFGFPRLIPPPEYLALDSPLVAWVQRERRTFAVNAVQGYPELNAFTQGAETPRCLLTPVYDRGNWLGILFQRDLSRGEAYDLVRDEPPTLAVCEAIVAAYREFRFILNPSAVPESLPSAEEEPLLGAQMEAVPVVVPPSESMFPSSSPRYVPAPGVALEGYPANNIREVPASLVTRSGRYTTRSLEEALKHPTEAAAPAAGPMPPRQELKPGMFLPEQRTFFWESASLLSSLVPVSAIALWVDDPHELRPILAYSRHPLSPELKQQILAHAMYHIPKVEEKDLQILIKSEWPDQEPLRGVFQTYLPVLLLEEGGGQDLLLLFRAEERTFNEQEQTCIQQMARLLGFHFQEGRLHENYHRAFLSVAHRILTSMEGGAPKLRTHSLNTARLARNLALHLELSSAEVEAVSIAAILHDVGTFMLDPGLVSKTPLTPEELTKIQTHPVLASIFLKDFRFPFDVLRIIRHHHERWDGQGYPDGLAGEAIPMESRIIHMVEAFEVMSSGSEFKSAVPSREILEELRKEAGRQFDPALVAGFLDFLTSKAHRHS
jgi:putative nucleotidyltransferase with HDIG domain